MAAERFIDFGSTWKYLTVPAGGSDEAPADPDYDDSSWATGPAPFGAVDVIGRPGASTWLPIATSVGSGTDVWVRAELLAGTEATIRIDYDARVYFNGVLVGNVNGPTFDADPVIEASVELPHESGVLAVWFITNVRGGLDGSYGDLSALGGFPPVRQYPRDDGTGLSSAPRLFPPPRRQRVVGGYQ